MRTRFAGVTHGGTYLLAPVPHPVAICAFFRLGRVTQTWLGWLARLLAQQTQGSSDTSTWGGADRPWTGAQGAQILDDEKYRYEIDIELPESRYLCSYQSTILR